MKKMTSLSPHSVALLLMLVPVGACAQPADQQTSARRSVATSPGVSLQDFVRRHEGRVLADDTDGDGKVSKAEFLAAAKSGKGDPEKRFARIDRNGDGMLDKSEIDAMLTRRFKRVDVNGDGVLSADERAAAHAAKGKTAGDGSDS